MTVYATGPDISSHQHDSGAPLNFPAARAAGHDILIVKATQSTGYSNPYFVQDVREGQAAGFRVMPYHYMGPEPPGNQADYFLSIIRQCFSKGPIWLDYEEHTNHSILHTMEQLLDTTPFWPGVYTFPWWWRQYGDPTCQLCARHRLWWANYDEPHNLAAPAPWTQVALRQTHGSSYAIPGIPGGNDMSRLEIPISELFQITPPPISTKKVIDMARRYLMIDKKTQIVATPIGKMKAPNMKWVQFAIDNGYLPPDPPEQLSPDSDADIWLRGLPWVAPPLS